MVRLPAGNVLVDTSPELRLQLLAADISRVDAVLFTHEHADHLHGIDDLRLFPFQLGHPVPLYCTEIVESRIRKIVDYAFTGATGTHPGSSPQLEFHRIDHATFGVLGQPIHPIRLRHGPRFDVLGFRIGSLAYCTDMTEVYPESEGRLYDLDVLIVDALRHKPHPTHQSVTEALQLIERLRPRQAYLTHMSHELDYDVESAKLPTNVALAYDGLRVRFAL